MPKTKLSDLSIKNLKAPSEGQVTYWDASSPVGVRVSQGGSRTFIVLLGSGRRHTLGRHPVVSLAQARTEAKRILAERTLGALQPSTIRFEDALERFLATHCAQKNKPSTAKETARLLRKHFLPSLRHRKLADITSAEISAIIDDLLVTPGTANGAFAAGRALFRWAQRRRYLSHNPFEGMHLPARLKPKERVLNDDELAAVWKTAGKVAYPFGTIVQLLILTGQRRGEIAALRWDYIDAEQHLVTLPPTVTKNNRKHVFPYGPMAATILKDTPCVGDLLFPARGDVGSSFSGWSKSKRAFDTLCNIEPWTLHDLRRTFATNLAALGTPVHVTEKLLNHVSGTISGVAAVYNRHIYLDEMREAVGRWEVKLSMLAIRGERTTLSTEA